MIGTFAMVGLALSASQANQSQSAGSSNIHSTMRRIRLLEENLSKTLLINEALWELIREKLNLTEDDLNNKLYDIDMRDGQLDGKNQRAAADCPKCHRKVSSRHAACIYCGQIIDDSVFQVST